MQLEKYIESNDFSPLLKLSDFELEKPYNITIKDEVLNRPFVYIVCRFCHDTGILKHIFDNCKNINVTFKPDYEISYMLHSIHCVCEFTSDELLFHILDKGFDLATKCDALHEDTVSHLVGTYRSVTSIIKFLTKYPDTLFRVNIKKDTPLTCIFKYNKFGKKQIHNIMTFIIENYTTQQIKELFMLDSGKALFKIACDYKNDTEILDIFLNLNINWIPKWQETTPLHQIVAYSDESVVLHVLDRLYVKSNNWNEQQRIKSAGGYSDWKIIDYAIVYRSPELIKKLITMGFNIHTVTRGNWSTIFRVITFKPEMLSYFLTLNPDLNLCTTEHKLYPVHHAITKSVNINLITQMLDMMLKDSNDIDYICTTRNENLVEFIINHGHDNKIGLLEYLENKRNVNLDTYNCEGKRPIHVAAINRVYNIIPFLLKKHVSADTLDDSGFAPLHYIILNNVHQIYDRDKKTIKMIKKFQKYGADIDILDSNGRDILDHLILIRKVDKNSIDLFIEIMNIIKPKISRKVRFTKDNILVTQDFIKKYSYDNYRAEEVTLAEFIFEHFEFFKDRLSFIQNS